jgi:hypothetical protein
MSNPGIFNDGVFEAASIIQRRRDALWAVKEALVPLGKTRLAGDRCQCKVAEFDAWLDEQLSRADVAQKAVFEVQSCIDLPGMATKHQVPVQ